MSKLRFSIPLAASTLLFVWTGFFAFTARAEEPAATVSFDQQIRPLLSDKCFACHGPDENSREADLRMDVRESAIESGAIVPGDPDQSELIRRILSNDPDERMPPKESHKELSSDEIELIRSWVSQGAVYQQHWSYRPIVRPAIPPIDPPQNNHLQNKTPQNNNAVDAFVLDRLADRDLEPSPRADKVTLVRRLYFDLLGVPPSYDEVLQFVNDDSPTATEVLVDRLLSDPRYGERMAVYWLDLVRYADTIGYHSDNFMEVSAYRDYVINAFNKNLSFDRFTIEQLAGDLLPEPTQQQRIASGYNRLLQTTEEGGAQAKEYITIYAADRVRNVSGVWMGQTVGCAQCHDHKYDPITAKDFYSMAAFFADIQEKATGRRKPNFQLISKSDKAYLGALTTQVAELQISTLLEADLPLASKLEQDQQDWESRTLGIIDSRATIWMEHKPANVKASGGVELELQSDGSLLSTGNNPDKGNYTYSIDHDRPIQSIRLEVMPDLSFSKKDGFSRSPGNFVLTNVKIYDGDDIVKIASGVADYEQTSWPIAHAFDNKKTSGWAIDGHRKPAASRTAVFRLASPATKKNLRIVLDHQSVFPKHLIGRFRISFSEEPLAGFGNSISIPELVLAALHLPRDQRTDKQAKRLQDYYQTLAPELTESQQRLAVAEKELADFQDSLQTMLVSKGLSKPRMTRILPRGNWQDESGEVVQPAVPDFLPHDEIDGRRATRMDLAHWLMNKDNPLTSRTFMNRLWKMFFGYGLSRNLHDLGGQGEAPTHPKLLDWLSIEFRESGWDVQHMVRLLVTSSTYAQSSVASPSLLSKDPLNRLFARQGRWRVEAEFVRDAALSISGLLMDEKIGGRSVKPYQPAGYWRHLNFPVRTWTADQDEMLYRRSLYTFWCRTFLHPAMLAFDAPSREECTAERARSNIPQQALVLLNDPVFVEASRVFAQRIAKSEGEVDDRITWAIRTAWSRDPRQEETALLSKLYKSQLQRYQNSREDALALLSVGAEEISDEFDPAELAAWTQVGRALLNAYETTSRF